MIWWTLDNIFNKIDSWDGTGSRDVFMDGTDSSVVVLEL